MRTLRVAILALGLAAIATTGCSKKKAPAAPMPTTEPAAEGPKDGEMKPGETTPAPDGTANPCGAQANPCGGGQ